MSYAMSCNVLKYYNAYLNLFLNIISLVYYLYILPYHFYCILLEYFLVHMGIPRWLTCISIICTNVLAHMVLSIGDMRRNGIQHHAPPDDHFLSSFIVLFNY